MAQQGLDKALTATKKARSQRPANLPAHDEISALAHALWRQRGSSDDDWYRAEQELRAQRASVS